MDSNCDIFNLNSTLAVVTGAGKGNGEAIANGLACAGARVLGVDLIFKEEGGSFDQIPGDVTSSELIDSVVARVSKTEYKHLVLVNNAGVSFPLEGSYPLDLWHRTFKVNLTAPFMWIEAFSDLFKRVKSGSIVNITSLGSEAAFPDNPAYVATKGGLKMLSKHYAKALGAYGIRVNSVGPGYMVTDMTRASYENKASREIREKHTLLGRWGSSEDLIGVCVFLASSASDYITGQDIYVDGGWTANGLIE